MDLIFIITSLLKIAILLGVILFMVSYAVYAERRVSAFIQDRLGPNRVGPAGLFQPIADMFKLLLKEDFTPRSANTFYYWLAPCMAVTPALITIAVVPFGSTLVRSANGNRRHKRRDPLRIRDLLVRRLRDRHWWLGVEFEISIPRRHSLQLRKCFRTSFRSGSLLSLFFYARRKFAADEGRALPNRARLVHRAFHRRLDEPMEMAARDSNDHFFFRVHDRAFSPRQIGCPSILPEAEQELAGGYNTEYSSMKFALYFLGEYAAMITGSAVIVTLFFGGWHFPGIPDGSHGWIFGLVNIAVFFAKVRVVIFFFMWVALDAPAFSLGPADAPRLAFLFRNRTGKHLFRGGNSLYEVPRL